MPRTDNLIEPIITLPEDFARRVDRESETAIGAVVIHRFMGIGIGGRRQATGQIISVTRAIGIPQLINCGLCGIDQRIERDAAFGAQLANDMALQVITLAKATQFRLVLINGFARYICPVQIA